MTTNIIEYLVINNCSMPVVKDIYNINKTGGSLLVPQHFLHVEGLVQEHKGYIVVHVTANIHPMYREGNERLTMS